jgi:hypothetical protein
MPIKDIPHQKLKGSGWNTRGYLPHFDGAAIPQFITLKLVDAIPLKVIDRWKKELEHLNSKEEQILMQRRIDVYLDQGYGSCYLKDPAIAAIVEESLLDRGFAQKVEFKNLLACEAGESVKPGALAPGQRDLTNQARETGESRRFSSFRPLRGLRTKPLLTWDWRPRLYAFACFAG